MMPEYPVFKSESHIWVPAGDFPAKLCPMPGNFLLADAFEPMGERNQFCPAKPINDDQADTIVFFLDNNIGYLKVIDHNIPFHQIVFESVQGKMKLSDFRF